MPSLMFTGGNVKRRDYRDLALEQLADDEAGLREANRQLIDLVADLCFEISTLTLLYECELRSRVHGDATIARLQRRLHQRVP
jgi:hypothetical protein